MSAAFGAGDVKFSLGGSGGASSSGHAHQALGNTISLEEIMNATKTTVSKATGALRVTVRHWGGVG